MKIEGSVALVTGANGGIGRAFVEELLKRGASKIYLGLRDPASVVGFPKDVRLVPVRLDVTDPEQIEAASKMASDVNLLINNAGVATFGGAIAADSLDGARHEMEVNYFGLLALARALKHTPVFSSNGAVLNILSFLALATLPVAGTYSASKAAALSATRTLRAELKPRGVVVVGAMPIQVDTAMGSAMPDPKVTPVEVASDSLDAVEAGQDEVFPGELSRGAARSFAADPAAVQSQLAMMVHAID